MQYWLLPLKHCESPSLECLAIEALQLSGGCNCEELEARPCIYKNIKLKIKEVQI
jgi:hypothetical protein